MKKAEVLGLNESDFLKQLETSASGLTQQEAEKRLLKFGRNIIGKKTTNAFNTLFRQFKSSLVYLLVIASLISFLIKDYSDGIVILIILFINTLLGFYQEYKSEKIIEKLSKLITKQVRIRRNGQTKLMDETMITVGDVVIVREGDIVSADMRLLEADDLEINESQLTGESLPVYKHPIEGLDKNSESLLFTGSIVERGMGVGAVYASGKDTELGLIAKLSTETKKISQYEQSLQSFSTSLIKIILIVLAIVFIVKLFLTAGHSNIPSLFLFIIALSVSTVPEVLPVIATVTLSSGAMKLTKKHVVVKRLSAIEDLGNVDLLCTDKTGTLTENKMTIASVVSDDSDLFQKLAYASVTPLKGRKHRIQNTYDDAFLSYVSPSLAKESKNYVLIKYLPFDPNDRCSRSILENKVEKKHYLVVVGAPESIFEISTSSKKSEYLDTISKEGSIGLNHLALAYKEIDYSENFDILKNENNLKFLGYVALVDPLRPTAKSAIEKAEKMGIKIKVLTGDSREVAEYVGRQVGLVQSGDKVYLGSELEKMSENDFAIAVHETNVFARVTPEQKFAIIKALKKDYVVAYQGDGINDAPALKLADVAVAVNSATDIAKENADIVLLNKSLEVITNGVVYGRSIFINVNKYIKYTMVNNFGILIALSILYLFSSILPILPIQALLNNLIGDIPLITVFSDNVDDEEIVKPEKHNMKEIIFISLVLGLPTAIFEIVYFVFIRLQPEKMVQTSLYVFLTFQALVIFYVVRTKKHFWNAKRPSTLMNIFFLLAFIVSLSVIYIPKFQTWFSFVPLTLSAIGVIFGLMILYFLSADFVKVRYYGWIATLPE